MNINFLKNGINYTTKQATMNPMAGNFKTEDLRFVFNLCKKAGVPVLYNNGRSQITAWTPEAAEFIESYDLYPVLIEDWHGEPVFGLKVFSRNTDLLAKINRRLPALTNPAAPQIQAAL